MSAFQERKYFSWYSTCDEFVIMKLTRENFSKIMLKMFSTDKKKTKENYFSSRREAYSN